MITKSIQWTPENGFDVAALEETKKVIENGGLVAFPTETVYGLGGNGLLPEASRKIYEAKGRPSDNPLILHIAEMNQLEVIAKDVPQSAIRLAEAFWPGPLTMVLHKAACVPYETTGGLDTVAVRMPEHPGALAFLKKAGVPVAAPSANTSGRPSPTRAEHVKEDLEGKVELIIDGGDVGIGFESTIIDMTEDVPVILRPGYITQQMMEDVIGKIVMDPALMSADPEARPKAPGMKYRHYAPKAEMLVFRGDRAAVMNCINEKIASCCRSGTYCAEEIGILTTEEDSGCYPVGQVVTAGSRTGNTVGRNLYRALRAFDKLHVKIIFSESFYDMDKAEAIMNRLLKAAGQNIVDVE